MPDRPHPTAGAPLSLDAIEFASAGDFSFGASDKRLSRNVSRKSEALSYASAVSSQFSAFRDRSDIGYYRSKVFDIVEHWTTNSAIMICVLANSIFIGLESIEHIYNNYGYYLILLDSVFLGIFIFEMTIKIFAMHMQYFRSSWNIFDAIIIVVSLGVLILPEIISNALLLSDARILRLVRMFRAMRAIRSIRALRSVNFLRSLQVILTTLFQSFPAMGSIAFVSLIVLYIFAVAGTLMYRNLDVRFATLGSTTFRLLQAMTLNRWSELYTDNITESQTLWWYLAIFIVLQTFIFLNLLVAVIVNNMQSSREHIEIKNRRRMKKGNNVLAALSEDSINESQGGSMDDMNNQSKHRIDNLVAEEFGLDNYYSPLLPWRTKEILSTFFMHISALEHNMTLYDRQQKVLEDLVNLAKEKDSKDNL